jgi:hypothetical protein
MCPTKGERVAFLAQSKGWWRFKSRPDLVRWGTYEQVPKTESQPKWLAFMDLSNSGGRIRTSDLRVMSVIEASRATPWSSRKLQQTRGFTATAFGGDVNDVCHVFQKMGYRMGYKFDAPLWCQSLLLMVAILHPN